MNQREKNISAADRWRLAEDIVEASLVDTVYRDLYLQRARDFLEPAMSESEFASLQLLENEASNLPNRIFVAMKEARWMEVKDLSSRMSSLKRTLTEKENIRKLGEKIYKPGEPPLDPFSPGLQGLARNGDPQALLDKLSTQLERLQTADPYWQGFYAARKISMATIKTYSSKASEDAELTGSRIEHKAFEALNSGDFANLEKMAALMGREESCGAERTTGSTWRFTGKAQELTIQFSQEILERAQDKGLSPIRMEAGSQFLNLSSDDLASLYHHLWQPDFTDEISRKKEIQLPANAPANFRDLVELFTLHPFVNSGGARFVPVLAEEDVLVEDFDEPDPGTEAPASALLSALGFEDRRGLSRISIEKALFDRGNTIVRDIGLDPRVFRLICIPPDVYGRVGHQRSWGQKPLWTHFDGYMVMKNGKLGALAGGDVRFGGLFDLVGISRDYDSDKIIARFAIVQRRRLETIG
ncbi:hypothetical protein [Geomobilimonas luticola]|uniref:Uncharacterized protein n=1 Tax=Geomobilimonas luticola TaxID=1114878 RepID=A0ABS5S9H5_9BACT|nr:hypothetical protein [Geomobilimonas luticola]MBT0652026.1 hypothetical protein [Geomobilimonas luticola]